MRYTLPLWATLCSLSSAGDGCTCSDELLRQPSHMLEISTGKICPLLLWGEHPSLPLGSGGLTGIQRHLSDQVAMEGYGFPIAQFLLCDMGVLISHWRWSDDIMLCSGFPGQGCPSSIRIEPSGATETLLDHSSTIRSLGINAQSELSLWPRRGENHSGLESMKKTRTRILPTTWVERFAQKEWRTRNSGRLGKLIELGCPE